MRKEYRNRRDAVLSAFQSSSFASRIQITEQGAGLHFLLRLDTAQSDEHLRKKAETAGVRLGFLSDYASGPDPAFSHTLVVNYAGLSPDRLPHAMQLLESVFFEPEGDTNSTFVLR
jgi:GntR family transcriptional regulator/MocR family aminotransferase